jgi:hypothetical protein
MCDWKALRAELATSEFFEKGDDLSTQRGIVATAIAILDRMSNSERLREVSWRPVRLVGKVAPTVPNLSAPATEKGNDPILVKTTPRKPAPGGIALSLPRPVDAFAIEG